MSFYISKNDGKYAIDYSINNQALFCVKFSSGSSYDIIPVNFTNVLPHGMSGSLFIDNIPSKNEYGCNISYYEISAFFKDSESTNTEHIVFSGKNPLGVETSNTNRTEKAVLKFWEIINLFDSIREVKEIFNTHEVLEYTNSGILSKKIEFLTNILIKYEGRLPYYLRNDIIDWIRKALLRFGLSTQRIEQKDFKEFPNTIQLLNGLGYQVYKQ